MTNNPISTRMSINSSFAQPPEKINLAQQSSPIKIFSTWVMLIAVFLLPVFVMPFTTSFIGHSKVYLLFAVAIFLALLYFFDSFKQRVWRIIISPITLPLFIFGLSVTASTFFTQNYPVENLLGTGGVYLASIMIALLGASLVDRRKINLVVSIFVGGVCVVNIVSLLQLLGVGPSHLVTAITGFEVDHTLLFNLSGSSLIALQLGLLALVGSISKIIISKKVNGFDVIALPILVFGIGLHLWSMLPGQPAQIVFPSFSASWSVALDSLRIPRAAIIGQGPEGYLSAFSRYRPALLNTGQFWQIRHDSAMGAPLTLLVQLGFLGLASWLLLATRLATKVIKEVGYKNSPVTWMLLTTFVLQFFLPPNFVLIGLQGLLIAFWIAQMSDRFPTLKFRPLSASIDSSQNPKLNHDKIQAEKIVSLFSNGVIIAGFLILAFFTGKTYASFHNLFLAEKSLQENDAVKYYEHNQKAMLQNPYLDSIRRSYAFSNIQIALALSNKTDITEEEQQQISNLVEQAVREAQASTTIDPQDSQNWLVLAQIYQELINSVDEADQWAVNAYVSAIQTDPTNPLIRIQLGNILLQKEQLQQAANLFSQAIELKPDLASGHFYLGQVQRLAQNPIEAKRSWQQALALLDPDTEDYQMLEGMLAELQPEVESAEAELAQQQEMTQQDQGGQPLSQGGIPEEATSPLGQQIPSLTDQNIENREDIVSQPGTTPLELSEDNKELLN